MEIPILSLFTWPLHLKLSLPKTYLSTTTHLPNPLLLYFFYYLQILALPLYWKFSEGRGCGPGSMLYFYHLACYLAVNK